MAIRQEGGRIIKGHHMSVLLGVGFKGCKYTVMTRVWCIRWHPWTRAHCNYGLSNDDTQPSDLLINRMWLLWSFPWQQMSTIPRARILIMTNVYPNKLTELFATHFTRWASVLLGSINRGTIWDSLYIYIAKK